MDRGAAGVMIAPPPHLRTDDEILAYFAGAAEAIGPDVPWVLQDYPLTLSVVMTPAVIRRIVTDNPGCVMLKHEDWPGLEKITALRAFQRDGSLRPLSILRAAGAHRPGRPQMGADAPRPAGERRAAEAGAGYLGGGAWRGGVFAGPARTGGWTRGLCAGGSKSSLRCPASCFAATSAWPYAASIPTPELLSPMSWRLTAGAHRVARLHRVADAAEPAGERRTTQDGAGHFGGGAGKAEHLSPGWLALVDEHVTPALVEARTAYK